MPAIGHATSITAASSRPRRHVKTGFLGLPRELRDMVYKLCVVFNYPVYPRYPHCDANPYFRSAIGLLLTSKAVHEEASSIFYSHNIIRCIRRNNFDGMDSWAHHIRHLRIEFPLFRCVLSPESRPRGEKYEYAFRPPETPVQDRILINDLKMDPGDLRFLETVQAKCVNLQRITVCVWANLNGDECLGERELQYCKTLYPDKVFFRVFDLIETHLLSIMSNTEPTSPIRVIFELAEKPRWAKYCKRLVRGEMERRGWDIKTSIDPDLLEQYQNEMTCRGMGAQPLPDEDDDSDL